MVPCSTCDGGADVEPRQSAHENRIYSLNIHCGDNYPDAPPTVQFVSKVNLPCVDPKSGKVKSQPGGQAILALTHNAGGSIQVAMPISVEEGEHNGDDPDRTEEVHGFTSTQEAASTCGRINIYLRQVWQDG